MLTCPLCRQNWVFISKLCVECDEIRHLISIYGLDNITNVLKTNLVRPQSKIDEVINIECCIDKNSCIDSCKNNGYKNTKSSEVIKLNKLSGKLTLKLPTIKEDESYLRKSI